MAAREGEPHLTRLGITGHRDIPATARPFVQEGLRAEIADASAAGDLWGVTSLAAGADQLFAELVLRAGGRLHVVVPAASYERTLHGDDLRRYRAMTDVAATVERLEFDEATDEAFVAAGARVVDACDRLVAVWDGQASRGLGGTADIVGYARAVGRPVSVVWPSGVTRPAPGAG